jgi:hypothetical protein
MNPMAGVTAEQALGLANERLEAMRAGSRLARLQPARPSRVPAGSPLRRFAASIRRALGEVETPLPAPRLADYPYRP